MRATAVVKKLCQVATSHYQYCQLSQESRHSYIYSHVSVFLQCILPNCRDQPIKEHLLHQSTEWSFRQSQRHGI